MHFQKIKRLRTALLAVFLCVFVFPVTAMAAHEANTGEQSVGSVLDGKLTITAEWYYGNTLGEQGSCTLSSDTVTLKASGNKLGRNYQSKVTITNSTDVEAEISFTYSTSNCYSYSTPAANGTYTVILGGGESCTLEIRSKSYGVLSTSQDAQLVLNGFSYTEVAESSQVTVSYNEAYGTVNSGGTIANGSTLEGSVTEAVTLTAAGANGGTFYGWVNGETGAILTTESTYTLYPAANVTVKAVFGSASLPCFYVGGGTSNPQKYGLFAAQEFTYHTIPSYTHLFDDLNAAATAAANSGSKYVILANSATLPAGNYTIPSGVTLLIPFDAANTVYTDKSQWRDYAAPTPYRTLTMAEGANLTLNGAMCVAGQHCPVSQDNTKGGAPSGPQGYVNMLEGSTITVNNGGNLYTYGFIYGQGSVTANNGAVVYEIFQVTDFRGAINSLSTMDASKKVLPFSQYYFQNIEVAVRFNYGAKLKLLINLDGSSNYFPSVIDCIGTGDGIFNNLDEGSYLVKQYDGATDRLKMDLYGNSSFYRSTLTALGMSLDTSDYVFAFNSNHDFRIHENSELLIKSDLCAIPGATLQIDAGAKISIEDGKKAYLYDLDQWDGYVHNSNYKLVPVSYAATKTYTRTEDDLTDAKLILNGTVDSTNGFLYTTASGADVTSTGAGKIILPKIANAVTYQAQYSSEGYSYPEIAVVSPILTNADGSQTATSTVTGGTFEYSDGAWTKTVCNHEYNDPTYNFAADGSSCTATRTCKGTGCTHSETTTATVTGAVKTAATCTTMGWTTYTATFGVDWATTQTKDVQDIDINADAHADANKDHLCDNGCGKTDIGTCEDGNKDHYCDYGAGVDGGCRDYFGTCSDSEDSEIDKDHVCDYGCGKVWNECSDVTTDSDHNCDVCGKENVTSHSYGEVTYKWTGYTACTASHTCNCSHVETIDSTITSEVTQAATCSATGVRTYTATFSETWAAAQTATETLAIEPNAHSWSVSYNWEKVEDQWTCTATHTCAHSEKCTETAAGTVTSSVAKAATCTATGNTLYTATFTDVSWAATQTQTVEGDIAALGHDEVSHEAKAPTCSAIGWDAYVTCSRCDYTTYVEKAALGHSYTSEVTTEPTCTEAGEKTYTCSACGDTYTETVAALGHDEVAHEAKAPTCTEIGWDAYVSCSRCDYTTYVEKAKLGHNYTSEVTTAATCTTAGVRTYTCSACGDTYTETVAALGHDEVAHEAKAPTCSAIGWDAYVTCSRCDYTTYVEKAALGHSYTSEVTTEPTCTEVGEKTYTCSACGDTYTETVAALGHDEVAHEAKAPTCTEIGWDAYETCSRCDYTTYVEKAKLGHSYTSEVTTAATCTTAGVRTYTCSACGDTYTETVAALGHDKVTHEAKTPTCTAVGWDAYETCSRCDYTTYVEKAALGHSYTSEVTTEPTCTEAGEKTYTCSACGDTYTETVAALGHDEVAHEAKAPTCTEIGWDAYVSCSRCDYTTYVEKAATGHAWKDATCTDPKTCTVCGATEGEANGHTEVVDKAVAATCTETGLTEGKHCSVCNAVLVAQNEVAALGHAWGEPAYNDNSDGTHTASYVCTRDASHTKTDEPAAHTYKDGECSDCGAVEDAGEQEPVEPATTYSFGQTVQIRLIEPWGLKANARVHVSGTTLTQAEYDALYDYGVYFIRGSELDTEGLTQKTVTVGDIINDPDAVHYTKGNGVTVGLVDGKLNLTATYNRELYTYEFTDSVFVLFYVVGNEGEATQYVPIRERNLSDLVNTRMTQTEQFRPEEIEVYKYMSQLETDITIYRALFDTSTKSETGRDIPTLAEFKLGTPTFGGGYSFGNTVQIRLIEPWGLKVNARVYTTGVSNIDYSALSEYGAVIWYDANNTMNGANMKVEELLAKNDALVYSSADGYAEPDTVDDKNVITARFDQGIYTYQLDTNTYVMFYIKDADGNYHYGDVKTRNVHDLMVDRSTKEDQFRPEERAVYTDMVNLYNAVTAYRTWYFENNP